MDRIKPISTHSTKYHCLEDLKRNSVELYLLYCGKEECNSGHSYGPSSRNEYLIHFIMSGKGTFICNDKKYKISENEAFLIMPQDKVYYYADSDDPWSYVWVGFNGAKSINILNQAGFSSDKKVIKYTDLNFVENCINDMLLAHKLTYSHDLIRQAKLMMLFSFIIEEYQKNYSYELDFNYPQKVYYEYALNYIDQHYSENIKVTDIASYIGIDRSYLTKIFNKILNISPQEYLINTRLSKAASLLKSSNYSISYISELVGYNTFASFSKAFKIKYSVSPKEYRMN